MTDRQTQWQTDRHNDRKPDRMTDKMTYTLIDDRPRAEPRCLPLQVWSPGAEGKR